jgi:hypothetical protein
LIAKVKEEAMAKKKLWVVMLVITFIMAACDNETDPDIPPPPPPPKPGESVSNPENLSVSTNLGTMTSPVSGWRELLDSINRDGKYVNLDLSACTMTGTSFDPDSTVATGKDKIVSIILPTVATSIEAGTTSSNPTFKNFTNLNSISGANITTIGNYSFVRSNLQSVDFPRTTIIGRWAFWSSSLKNADFPAVQSIGEDAFSWCSDLQSISLPASAEIGRSSSSYSNPFTYCRNLTSFTISGSGSLSVIENGKALVRDSTILFAYPSATGTVTIDNITSLDGQVFGGCSDLTSVNFPQVTSIGSEAFSYCSNLQDVSFPQVTSISSYAFEHCSNLQDVNFPQATSIDGAFWSCDRLQSASFPEVTTIGGYEFNFCSNLLSLNIPKVTNIGGAFHHTGDTTLTITMGSAAPTLSYGMFDDITDITTAKTVRVKVPAGASGYSPFPPAYGSSVTVSGTNTNANWANGFRGGGWNGTTWGYGGSSYINQNITVIIERQ